MKRIFILALMVIVISGCAKQFLADDPDSDPISNFEHLWHELNNKYSYFEYKSIDWDDVYSTYRPMVYDGMSETELFDVLASMLYELNDGHVNITSPFDRSRNWNWFLDYPANFNENIIYRNYLGSGYRITGPLHNKIIDGVLYVYYSSFGNTISEANIDELITRTQEVEGIIIDIRSNGGGSSGNAVALASALTDKDFDYGYSRVKNGPAEDDFSPWRKLSISPRSGKRYTGQVVLLCNRNSYSSSNLFAQMMKSLPNAMLVGDNTGGGGGIPAYGELPNGWIFRFSATQTINPQGELIENGVPVDISVELSPVDEANGFDTILEAALSILKPDK